jgi:acetyl esterase/lipase
MPCRACIHMARRGGVRIRAVAATSAPINTSLSAQDPPSVPFSLRPFARPWLLLCSWMLAACSESAGLPKTPDTVFLAENVPYCVGGNEILTLDVARPRNGAGPSPAVLLVHGGGWGAGTKQEYRAMMLGLAQAGMVAVSVDYRLAPAHRFPAPLEDVKCAVRWMRAHAPLYRMDARRIVALGGSAGAHLVAMLGTTGGDPRFEGRGGFADHSSRIDAMVLHAGPYDLTTGYEESLREAGPEPESVRNMLSAFLGGAPATKAATYRDASPASHVSAHSAPALLIHGRNDTLIPPSQAIRFDGVLRQAGVPSELVIVEGAGHSDFGPEPDRVTQRLLAFLRLHLAGP